MAEFLLTFEDNLPLPARAVARIRLEANNDKFINFEVVTNEIPVHHEKQGKDVVVEWSFPGMDMGNKLWYAANSLQMMDKTLNHREQYHLETNQTYSTNFYPVTSAIAARDMNSDLQVTMMNDRTQSGSAGLRNANNIEMMQNRRLLIDDSKGIREPLDELDPRKHGRGI